MVNLASNLKMDVDSPLFDTTWVVSHLLKTAEVGIIRPTVKGGDLAAASEADAESALTS
jgi:hypothetical protein